MSAQSEALRLAAQQALEALEGYRRELGDQQPCDAEQALEAALAEPVQEPVACLIGTKGSAFDSPTTKRAYTYAEQPGNVVASRLGLACNAAASQSAGDSIDRGLGLLQELQRQGFGVFDLGAEYAAPPQRPAEPVQEPDSPERRCGGPGCDGTCCQPVQEPQGCAHCNHPLYAAVKCKVCGRVTEPAQEPVQEPVAIVGTQEDTWKGYGGQWAPPGPPIKTVHMLRELPEGTLLYAAPPQRPAEPVQEPVLQALADADRIMGHDDESTEWRERWKHLFGVAGSATSPWRESAAQGCSPGGTGMPAALPQRKPLTEEELDELAMDEDGLPNSHLEFARAIERAHGVGGEE